MRILHIIYTHGISGAEKYLDYLLPGLINYGIKCDLMIVCPLSSEKTFSEFVSSLRFKGIDSSVIVANRRQMWSTAKKINNYLKNQNISIIHSHLLNTDILVALVKQFFNKKVFIISTKHGYNESVLNTYSPQNYKIKYDLYYYITRYTLKKIDQNIAVSKGMADLFYNLRLTKKHFPVLHHGVTVTSPGSSPGLYRKAKKQLIITGRLETMKGHEYLLTAMPEILEVYPECKLLILGDGSLKEKLVKQCETLKILNNVEFLGFQSNPYSYISNSDIIVLPSLFEPFGLVYIEAHALKIPVVAFDTPAANELMENMQTGVLVTRHNTSGLSEKIIYLLEKTAEATNIAEKAYKQYLNKFTSEVMVKKTADFYRSLNINKA